MLKEKLDQLIQLATRNHFSQFVYEAKKEYQKVSGEPHEDDKSYESRMALFLEWYVFDRPLPGKNMTPLEMVIQENRDQWTPETLEIYEKFKGNVHGIFVLKKIRDDHVKVTNLFDGNTYQVRQTEDKIFFSRNDIFEGRILPFEEKHYFTGDFCFHPPDTYKYIRGEAKKIADIKKGYLKELKNLKARVKPLQSKLNNVEKKIQDLRKKIENAKNDKKTNALKEMLKTLEETRSAQERELSDLGSRITQIENDKIKGETVLMECELMQRLAYMNLKWERFRQVSISDIYRN